MHGLMANYAIDSYVGHLLSLELCLTHSNYFFFVSSFHLEHMNANCHKKVAEFYPKNAPEILDNDIVSSMVCHLWSLEFFFSFSL